MRHGRATTEEYLDSCETTARSELQWGTMVREPAAPLFSHQALVLRVARTLCDHVEPLRLGHVAIAPVDVVLDRERALVVQPDVLFVSSARQAIIRDQVWGAPDLVVEVLSPSTEGHDRGQKLEWYREYGVRECWLVDLYDDAVTVVDFSSAPAGRRVARGADRIQSTVLPNFRVPVSAFFSL